MRHPAAREVQPCVYVTYNGDFFDFPFMARGLGIKFHDIIPNNSVHTTSSSTFHYLVS